MTAITSRSLAFALLALLVSPLAAEAAQWSWPLASHRVARSFDFDGRDPYRAGAKRGVTLSGRPGAQVFSACSGIVSFAGRLPDGRRGVTVRCGDLSATELGLSSAEVGSGQTVIAGQPLGTLAVNGMLAVGARRTTERSGYRDPVELFGAQPAGRSPAPLAPRGRRPKPAPPAAVREPAPIPGASPWLLAAAWFGLGLCGTAVGAGIALHGRGRRRAMAPAAASQPQSDH